MIEFSEEFHSTVIIKPDGHDINAAGERLLREVLEPLGWVVNAVEKDYGIDYNVQAFDGKSPTGTWFHVQLKSSASSEYSADRFFVSQEITVDHARHYTLEMREPVLVIHADVESRSVHWYAPQLDRQLATVLSNTKAKFTTFLEFQPARNSLTPPQTCSGALKIFTSYWQRESLRRRRRSPLLKI